MKKFQDRCDAGEALAAKLKSYSNRPDAIVLGLARGGVPVAAKIAASLSLPLDVFIVRKLGVPGYCELAMGAIADGPITVLNESVIARLQITEVALKKVVDAEARELLRRNYLYRDNRPLANIENKIVILVDDGVATGASIRVAVKTLRLLKPSLIIIAIPVAERIICERLKLVADKVICLLKPKNFSAVSKHYLSFDQTSDQEVYELLAAAMKMSS